ncbi:MAG: phosphohistidine phosphatase SixA [Ignavibacteriaceae bacterium]
MNLYLMRHGEAENIKAGLSDSERQLTATGISNIEKMFHIFNKSISQFDFLLSSPLIRAVQTTQQVKILSQSIPEILIENVLKSGEDIREIIPLLNALKGRNIFICGHEPEISRFCSLLISKNYSSLLFKPGAFAKISFEGKVREAAGTLQFLFNPMLLK